VPNSPPSSFPGGLANVTGNDGGQFAVQSEWSNADNAGSGWCAGLPQDNSPAPLDPFDNYTAANYPSDVAPGGNGHYGVPASTGAPSVSGVDTAGNTLTANPGSWNDAPTDYVYQWVRCGTSGSNCAAIDGATSSTYTLTRADVGSTVGVTVNAANTNGNAVPVMSPATKAIAAHGGGGDGLGHEVSAGRPGPPTPASPTGGGFRGSISPASAEPSSPICAIGAIMDVVSLSQLPAVPRERGDAGDGDGL
jgi:hypothetical protein